MPLSMYNMGVPDTLSSLRAILEISGRVKGYTGFGILSTALRLYSTFEE